MRRSQLIVVAGAFAALLLLIVALLSLPGMFGSVDLPSDNLAARIAFFARWSILPALTLLAGIVGASRRGFYKDAIDGTRWPENHGLEINLRYNQNTLEQLLLGLVAWLGLATTLPHPQLVLIPAAVAIFTIGRICFWIGYLIHPSGRAFGMVLTMLPTLAAYLWLSWTLVRK